MYPSHISYAERTMKLYSYVLLFLHKNICFEYSLEKNTNEVAHDKTYKIACKPNEDSDQPRHQPRVFSIGMKKAWVLCYPLSAQQRLWSDLVDAQADLSLRWEHTPFCRFCHALAQIIFIWIPKLSKAIHSVILLRLWIKYKATMSSTLLPQLFRSVYFQ